MKTKLFLILASASVLAGSGMGFAQTEPKWDIKWTDHTANPVDVKSPGSRAYMPCVLYRTNWPPESRFRIWYDTASIAGIGYSTSADGVNWSNGAAVTGLNTDGTSPAGRPVVLFNTAWLKPYRLYYYGNPGDVWQIRVAESADGIAFSNDQVALEGGRLGTFPDGHAVVYIAGRNPDPNDPEAARPFILYFRDKDGKGIAFALSKDGYIFTEGEDNPDTADVDEGLIRVSGLPVETPVFVGHPTQVLSISQNDFRMFAFEQNTNFKYLVSPNGMDWALIEDPVAIVGGVGAAGTWNDERNYYASAAYLGDGKFVLYRGGRATTGDQLYRVGAAFGDSGFYKTNDIGKWSFYSPMTNWEAEGWATFTSTDNLVDGTTTAVIQNADGTVSVRDRKDSGNFYMVHDTSWAVPYTFEFRAKLDDATTTGTGTDELPKYTFSAFQTDELNPGGESWQPAFAANRFGRWTLADETVPTAIADADNTQFQTYTVVCSYDESARAQLAADPANATANVNLCIFEVYLNRDFSAPKAKYNGTGFVGWPSVDADGRLDIGFPGPSSGQMTVDWVRWGNGVILDSNGPDSIAAPKLSITRVANGVQISWTGGGTLQSANEVTGTWNYEADVSSGTTLPAAGSQKFYRVRQ
jgi:hypothetical protein